MDRSLEVGPRESYKNPYNGAADGIETSIGDRVYISLAYVKFLIVRQLFLWFYRT